MVLLIATVSSAQLGTLPLTAEMEEVGQWALVLDTPLPAGSPGVSDVAVGYFLVWRTSTGPAFFPGRHCGGTGTGQSWVCGLKLGAWLTTVSF